MNDEPTRSFRVTWTIDIDATSHEEAARKALAIQREPESTATVFSVRGEDEPGTYDIVIDLESDE